MFSSIRSRLIGGFLLCAIFASIAGVVGLVAVSALGDSASRVMNEQLPMFDAAQDTALAARGVRMEVEHFLRSTDGLPAIREQVEHGLTLVELYVSMMRDGTTAALAANPAWSAISQRAGVDVMIDKPASGRIRTQIDLVQSQFQEVSKAALDSMEVHEVWAKLATSYGGRTIELDKFFYIQRLALSRWIAELEEAARFGSPVKGGTDYGSSEFAVWRVGFKSEDPKLEALISAFVAQHRMLFDLANQIEAAPVEQRVSLMERARTRVVARSVSALQAVIDYLAPRMNELGSQADRTALTLNKVEGEMVAALDKLRKLVDEDLTAAKAETVEIQSISLRVSVISVGLGLATAIGISLLIGRGISGRLAEMTATMGLLAEGALETLVPQQDKGDEIGQMARSVEIFRKGLSDAEALRAETRKAQDAAAIRAQEITALVREMEGVVLRTAGEIREASDALRETAGRAGDSATDARGCAAEATAASQMTRDKAQSVAAATEELSSSISEIGRQASLSASISETATSQMQEASQRVDRLSDAAQRIGSVLQLISQIAGQTNLLALNATIEAARAGEAGRGFAIVASEVKALAHQTARATSEISEHIAAIQAETGLTASAILSVSDIIERARESTVTIASAVEQQGAATTDIAVNIQTVSDNSTTVEMSCQQTDGRVNDLLADSEAVQRSADQLAMSARGLQTEMDRYFERFRA